MFRQKLAHDALSLRAHRGTQSRFVSSASRAGQQQIGNIRAGHKQHQANRGEQRKQRWPHQSYVVGLQRRDRQMQRLVGKLLRLTAKPAGNRFRFALRLPHRDALAQPADHSQETYVPVAFLEVIQKGNEYLHIGHHAAAIRKQQFEISRQHANNREVISIQPRGLPDNARIGPEFPPPQSVGQNHQRGRAPAVFARRKETSQLRLFREQRQEICRREGQPYLFRLGSSGDGAARRPDPADLLERAGSLAQLHHLRPGSRPARLLPPGRPEDGQPVCLGIRQRSDQHPVDHAEDRRVRANPERQGQDPDRRKSRRLPQHARAEPYVGPHRFQPEAAALFAALFLEPLMTAKFDSRSPLRLRARRARPLQVLRAIEHVRSQLLIRIFIFFNACAIEHGPQQGQQFHAFSSLSFLASRKSTGPHFTPMKIAAYLIEKIGSTVSGYFHPSLWLSESHELLVTQRRHRIHTHCPPRRQVPSQEPCSGEKTNRCDHG